jgi:hypothetical protein
MSKYLNRKRNFIQINILKVQLQSLQNELKKANQDNIFIIEEKIKNIKLALSFD